ncbi:hypothetical protein IWQ57_000564 [Coemansia nantahalensis]|uniref:Uncharacterized protein n=1 Tax=Coemansia nantahalensis TaxID=2789366 RepID=A0ACC1K7T6_9FUNG|nr:hypothetical protein IWQ57_000564 [Coemansia nantahalensis]
MDLAVVDLTDSPPLASAQAEAFSRPREDAAAVVVSSDDDPGPSASIPGVTALPNGYVLPPIRRPGTHDHGHPERITTLRDVLSTRNPHHRTRSRLPMHVGGPPGAFVPHMLPHTGDEPVEAGVYYPIRARAILPGERQRRQRRSSNGQQRQQERPASRAGRETADGSIDVEDVEEGSLVESDGSFGDEGLDTIMDGIDEDEDDYLTDTGEDDDVDDDDDHVDDYGVAVDGRPLHPGATTGQTVIEYLIRRQEAQRAMAERVRAGGMGGGPGGRRAGFVFPFNPGMVPPHMRNGQGHITPFDFFPGEDISALLTYLEATTPAPVAPAVAPPAPLKMSKHQTELAGQPDYTRAVPAANFRDSTDPVESDHLEIVCVQCEATLFDKEPIWAPSCGHILCNTCVEGVTAATKTCTACRKRSKKTTFVRLYL